MYRTNELLVRQLESDTGQVSNPSVATVSGKKRGVDPPGAPGSAEARGYSSACESQSPGSHPGPSQAHTQGSFPSASQFPIPTPGLSQGTLDQVARHLLSSPSDPLLLLPLSLFREETQKPFAPRTTASSMRTHSGVNKGRPNSRTLQGFTVVVLSP